MCERDVVRSDEIAKFLDIPIQVVNLLYDFEYLPPPRRMNGSDLYYWTKIELNELYKEIGPGGVNRRRIDYLMMIRREE